MIVKLFSVRWLSGPRRVGITRRRGWLVAGAVAAVVPLLTGMMVPGPPGGRGPGPAVPRPVPAQRPVPVHAVRGHPVKVPVMRPWRRPATAWPAAGAVTVNVPAGGGSAAGAPLAVAGPGDVRAGRLPVWAGPARGSGAVVRGGAAGVPSRLRVVMASRRVAAALGVRGVVFSVARAHGGSGGGRVHVSFGYSSFAYAYGGDYASRLRLVELPACALTTPQIAACRVQRPLRSADDVRAAHVGANVTLPQAAPVPAVPAPARSASATTAGGRLSAVAAPATSVVRAATASTSGSGGSYTATSLSEAGTWAEGGSSGAFTFSYPISVPPVPGGLEPEVALNYDSQAVDGLTSSTNSQASWIGDGWGYSPGFVERSYKSCEQNPSGPTKTGDFCWSSNDTVTLSLNGQDTTLVKDDATGTWHPEADDHEKVSYLTGPSNGTHDGGYWVVTTTDGTSYYFGMNQLPGYASGNPVTNSAWTVPVFATASGQPCYNSTFASSWCDQAWRWNLDYVTDRHGDAVAYFYSKETNYYARDNGTTASAAYTQAGALTTIRYGLRAGAVYGHTPAGQVNFTHPEDRTDIPSDLSCSNNSSCAVQSPTFWAKYRLTTVATKALSGSSLANADSWALAQSYPSTGDPSSPPSLWLDSITRTGQDGTAVELPPVTFAGRALANRVETQADLNSGYSIITRRRLTSITNETGGVTSIDYLAPSGACTGSGTSFPPPDANTLLCYPDYWAPPGHTSPILDWFNKYLVDSVTQQDTTGNDPPVVTSYSYAGRAWHYNDDALTRSVNRTWDQWRGAQTVTTHTGAAPDPVTTTVDTYFQGMNGDYQANGTTASVSLTSSKGDTVTDSDQFAGQGFEHIVDNGTAVVTDSITLPWTSAATATHSQPSPLPPLTAYMTGTTETKDYTSLAAGGSRQSDTTYTHDSQGRVTSASDVPDTTGASQDTCTTTSYASNTSAWILTLPAEVRVVSVPCTATPSFPADAVSDTLTFYDGATSPSQNVPSNGDVTQTQKATSYSGSSPGYTTESTATYDEYGRVLTSLDADQNKTTTAYTPVTGAEPTSVAVTDPVGLATTTAYDPARDLPTSVTDPAGYVTTETYDALGRLTRVWKPGSPQSSSPASLTFGYTVSATAPSVVTTNTINPAGGYAVAKTLYDSLGRIRETQTQTFDGKRDVSDILYNSDGWKILTSDPYYATGAPSNTLVAAPDDQVPSQTGYVYDRAGRVTRQISYKLATETWETDTSYGGDYVTTIPPAGGTPQTSFTDGRGLTTAIYQYHAGVPADPSGPASGYDKTSYTYTPAQKLATITDAAGNGWSYSYDLLGDQTSQTDPDTGSSTSAYDAAGQLMSVTDARGKQTSYTYDHDSRKTGAYDTTGGAAETSADQIASWTYDTLKKGLLTSTTSYAGGAAYTQAITGYNSQGLPSGTRTSIPATAQTGALAGTYQTGMTYNTYTAQQASYTDSAAGGLPQETVSTSYDSVGEPTGVGSPQWSYVGSLSYTELGLPLEYTMGTGSEPAWVVDSYDQQTNRLTEQQTSIGQQTATAIVPTAVSDLQYGYDHVGNVTSESDTVAGDYQCFSYDYLGRLADAWAQGSSGCASSPSAAALGGPSAYWQHLGYNVAGNITTDNTTYNTSGTNYVDQANTYPAPGTAQPHTMTSQNVVSSADGSWTNSDNYNPAGDLTTRQTGGTTQQLTWNDQGKLAQISDNSGNTTSYVYDSSGGLLLRSDPGQTTLYLPDEELVLDTSTGTTSGTVSGTRYYTLGGVTVASRTSSGHIAYLAGDQHGTSLLAIDSANLAVTRRYYTPFGALRSPSPGSWPGGDKGFVGGTTDTTTTLTNLGAREYDTSGGTFASTDPLLNPYDPQNLNPYAYAQDNPTTSSDPTGLTCVAGSPRCQRGAPPPPDNGGRGGSSGSGSGASCPDYLPGCPGFTGGGAGPGGEPPYGPPAWSGPGPHGGICSTDLCGRPHPPDILPVPVVHHTTNGQPIYRGYHYTYHEIVGPAADLPSPTKAMALFQRYPKSIFPFPITGCSSFKPKVRCTLHAAPSWLHGVGTVSVSTTATSFTFTVVSNGYFDAPGSQVTFSLSQQDGELILTQHAQATDSSLGSRLAVLFHVAKSTWDRQAENLYNFLYLPYMLSRMPHNSG